MRGSLGRLTSNSSSSSSCFSRGAAAFSTFSGGEGGGGRGRGRGSSSPSNPQIGAATTPGKPINDDDNNGEIDEFPSGLGHGRGKPLPSNPILPAFSSWMSGINPSVGRGRTIQESQRQPPPPPRDSPSQGSQSFQPKKPIFFRREDVSEHIEKTQLNDSGRNPERGGVLPSSLSSGLPGAGRGKAMKFTSNDERVNEENRHIRPPQGGQPGPRRGGYPDNESQQRTSPSPPRLSREDAAKKAIGILSRAGGGRGGGGGMEESERGGRGFRGRGGRGRRGMMGRRGGRDGRGRGRFRDSEDDYTSGLYLGDNADGERLAKKVGVENMDKLTEAFEEMSTRVLPSPAEDAYLDAVHTNNLIEYEPEYLMGDFGTNPDIDDTPPIPLRDALEKMKPFLMAYEGIKDQDEWEKVMKETMDNVPVMKELIDMYSGPDRVTSKQQMQELERVAKTLPENVPASVKRYTDRAVLSLQVHPRLAVPVKSYLDELPSNVVSFKKGKNGPTFLNIHSNPGWGWDKKCQFMDKLVWEVSQQYK